MKIPVYFLNYHFTNKRLNLTDATDISSLLVKYKENPIWCNQGLEITPGSGFYIPSAPLKTDELEVKVLLDWWEGGAEYLAENYGGLVVVFNRPHQQGVNLKIFYPDNSANAIEDTPKVVCKKRKTIINFKGHEYRISANNTPITTANVTSQRICKRDPWKIDSLIW